jgi:hypothetical protein
MLVNIHDNIRLDLREIGLEGVHTDQWRALVNTVMNLQFHKRSHNPEDLDLIAKLHPEDGGNMVL